MNVPELLPFRREASSGSEAVCRSAPRKPRRGCATLLLSLALLLIPTALLTAESFPHVRVHTLAGKVLALPEALKGHDSFLVIGFTKASEKQTVVWRKKIQRHYAGDPRLVVYPVIVLERIPGLFRGLVIDGIRRGFPRKEWDHFLVVEKGGAIWKRAVGWKGPNVGYLLLLGPDGRIVWRRTGAYTAQGAKSLEAAIASTTARGGT